MPLVQRLGVCVIGITGFGLIAGTDVQAHQKHKHHHHSGHHHGGHHNHQYKKAKAYNKGYKHGLKTGAYQAPYGYGYGYGYRPYSRPVVVAPGPWGAPPVQVGPPSMGFGFYF